MSNALESALTMSPFNKDEECARFTIDNLASPFVLNGVVSIGQTCTLSLWVKSDEGTRVTICGSPMTVSSEWTKHTLTFQADSENVSIRFGSVGTYYIYHLQLELGNTATDWAPNPDDIDEQVVTGFNDVANNISDSQTKTIDLCNELLRSELESYVGKEEYEEYKEVLASQLQVLEDGIVGQVTGLVADVENLDNDLQEKFNLITKYFTFDLNGLTIGQVDNPNKVVIDNDEIKIMVHNVVVQHFKSDGSALIPILNVTQRLNLMGLQVQEDGEHINCDWLGIQPSIISQTIAPLNTPIILTNSTTTICDLSVKAKGDGLSFAWEVQFDGDNTWFTPEYIIDMGGLPLMPTVVNTSDTSILTINANSYVDMCWRCAITDWYGNTVYSDYIYVNFVQEV